MEESAEDPVVTHGEPHPGNLIHTEHGLRLIDWDTVALATPERDLWMLDDGSPDGFAAIQPADRQDRQPYGNQLLPAGVDPVGHRLFADMFRSDHSLTGWIEQKWRGFLQRQENHLVRV